jgi:hypothetical protein
MSRALQKFLHSYARDRTLTIVALAIRQAEYLAGRLSKNEM